MRNVSKGVCVCVFRSQGGPAHLSQSYRGSWTIAAWPVTTVTMAVCSLQSPCSAVGGVAVWGPLKDRKPHSGLISLSLSILLSLS